MKESNLSFFSEKPHVGLLRKPNLRYVYHLLVPAMGSQARDADSVGARHELGKAVAEGIADHQRAHVV